MSTERFKKQPDSPFTNWLRGILPPGVRFTKIASESHQARLLYNSGISKAELLKFYSDLIDLHEARIRDIRAGRHSPNDSIEDRERAIEKAHEGLDEVNGLPDDE